MATKKRQTRSPKKRAAPTARTSRQPTLALHRSIYPARAVNEAVEAFAGLATVQVTQRGDYHRVRLTPLDDTPPDRLANEFANYALSRAARNR